MSELRAKLDDYVDVPVFVLTISPSGGTSVKLPSLSGFPGNGRWSGVSLWRASL